MGRICMRMWGGNPVLFVDPTGMYAGYGNGPYSNYYATKSAGEAAGQQDYADASALLGDALTIATPFSGPIAPYVGGMATGFTVLSIGLDPSQNWKTGGASILIEKSATLLLKKVQAPLRLSNAKVSAAAGLLATPLSLANVANRASNSNTPRESQARNCP